MSNYASFIWGIADLLRGSFKIHKYADFILPLRVFSRLGSVLADTKPNMLEVAREVNEKGLRVISTLLAMADTRELVEALFLGGLQPRLRGKAVDMADVERRAGLR